jgi:hypothetical protein
MQSTRLLRTLAPPNLSSDLCPQTHSATTNTGRELLKGAQQGMALKQGRRGLLLSRYHCASPTGSASARCAGRPPIDHNRGAVLALESVPGRASESCATASLTTRVGVRFSKTRDAPRTAPVPRRRTCSASALRTSQRRSYRQSAVRRERSPHNSSLARARSDPHRTVLKSAHRRVSRVSPAATNRG